MSVTYFEATDKVTRVNVNEKIDEINFQNNELDTKISNQETKINTARAGVELFSSGGTRGTITLSDNVSNYDYLEIYWKENTATSFFCSKVAPTFKPKWSLCEHHYSSADGYYVFNSRFINITETTITQSNVGYANVKTNTYPNVRTEDNLYILKVKGYKNNI